MFGSLFKKKEVLATIQSSSLLNISSETKAFFEALAREFSFLLFDEILILRKLDVGYEMVHHQEYGKDAISDEKWKERVIKNIDFFLNRILKKDALADGEGVFTWNQDGALFDVMVREGNYYIMLNNSTESLSSLMKNHPFNEAKLIQFLSNFARHFTHKNRL